MSNNTLNLILASDKPELFKELLKKDDIDYKELFYYLIKNSSVEVAKNGSIVQSIYTKLKFRDTLKVKLLKSAAHVGFIELITILQQDLKDKPNYSRIMNGIFELASASGHTKTVRLLLNLKEGRVDPGYNDNDAIRWASRNGWSEVVKLLLNDPRVDPRADNNSAIRWASRSGYIEVVRLLLADPRVDPGASNNFAIKIAAENRHLKTVKLLLADPKGRVNPGDSNNKVIQYASTEGWSEIVKLLLADPRVNPGALNNWAIRQASYYGRTEVVKLLLADKRVNPDVKNSSNIRLASVRGHGEVVKLLSLHPKLAHPNQLNPEILTSIVEAWLVKN